MNCPPYILRDRTIRLARWEARVDDESGVRVEFSLNQPRDGSARPINQTGFEWADGAYVPDGYTPEQIFKMGEAGYRALPTESEELRAELSALTSAIERGLGL